MGKSGKKKAAEGEPETPARTVKVAGADVAIPTGEISIAARKDGHRRNGMVHNRRPINVTAEDLGWTDPQWAEALGDRFMVIGDPADPTDEAPGLTQEEVDALAAGGEAQDAEATEPNTDEEESR